MAFNFPTTPTDGDEHTESGATWSYDATLGVWRSVAVPSSALLAENNLSDVDVAETALNNLGGLTTVVITQAAYDALATPRPANTHYLITA